MSGRSLFTRVQHRARSKARTALGTNAGVFKRALRRVSDAILEQIMVSLAGCCVNSGASQGCAPYHRLERSRSLDSHADVQASTKARPGSPNSFVQPTSIDDEVPPRVDAPAGDIAEDTVVLKVGIVGDSETGKTSFLAKYITAGDIEEKYVETIGVASAEKVLRVQNASIAFSIWDLGGGGAVGDQCSSMLPMVCRDAAAILIMFDLTRRSTLLSVKEWFLRAKGCNKTAIPVIIGTKYDHFVDLPQDIQLAILHQARFYAQAMGASLFFSSVTHNINIHKIFKIIVAKLFDLPCNIARNLNLGEPIVDY